MADNEKNFEEIEESPILTLSDEETGEEKDFILLASASFEGRYYYAIVPADDPDTDEYIILDVEEDGEDLILSPIEDDDLFDRVEDYFNDTFFNDMDYDA
ncbi:MAG: DUF1292 domain-containing protein [Clostridia bacterium]|nr:DUF1292 domain-containing protein [Clostridia bacterium]